MLKHEKHFLNAYKGFLKAGGTVERALEIIASISELPGDGLARFANTGPVRYAETGQAVEGEGQTRRAAEQAKPELPEPSQVGDKGHLPIANPALLCASESPHSSRGSGHPSVATSGPTLSAAPREPDKAFLAAQREVKNMAAATIFETLTITDDNGAQTGIGELYVASLDRWLHKLNKRTWIASKQRNSIYLVKKWADKQAHIPDDAKVKDVLSIAKMEEMAAEAINLKVIGNGILPVPDLEKVEGAVA